METDNDSDHGVFGEEEYDDEDNEADDEEEDEAAEGEDDAAEDEGDADEGEKGASARKDEMDAEIEELAQLIREEAQEGHELEEAARRYPREIREWLERRAGELKEEEQRAEDANGAGAFFLSVQGHSNSHSRYLIESKRSCTWRPKRRKDQTMEDFRLALGADHGPWLLDGQEVQPLRYDAGDQTVCVQIRSDSKLKCKPSEVIFRDRFSKHEWKLEDADWVSSHHEHVWRLEVTTAELLEKLGSRLNANLIEATVSFEQKSRSYMLQTLVPLHLLRQKLIVLLPGVLGSKIFVESEGKKTPAWPPPYGRRFHGSTKSHHLGLLSCKRDGEPELPASELTLFGLAGYACRKWQRWMNSRFPKLSCGPRRVPYIVIQDYPYDWRLKPTSIIEAFLGEREELDGEQRGKLLGHNLLENNKNTRAIVNKMHSLETLFAAHRDFGNSFLDAKVAVAGHSTGGVLLNGIARDRRARHRIDHAFFIATPFRGAPKAWYAFITGNMDLERIWGIGVADLAVWNAEVFFEMAPNLPIVYLLAPTRGDTSHCVRFYRDAGPSDPPLVDKCYYKNDPTAFMTSVAFEATHDETHEWRRPLHQVAEEYHRGCAGSELQVPPANCLVFYTTGRRTRGNLICDLRSEPEQPLQEHRHAWKSGRLKSGNVGHEPKPPFARLFSEVCNGDGTVPRSSLIGPKDLKGQRRKIAGKVNHLSICDAPKLWEQVCKLIYQTTFTLAGQDDDFDYDFSSLDKKGERRKKKGD